MLDKIKSLFAKFAKKNNNEKQNENEAKVSEVSTTNKKTTDKTVEKKQPTKKVTDKKTVTKKLEPLEAWGMSIDVLGSGDVTTVVILADKGDEYIAESIDNAQEVVVPKKEVDTPLSVNDQVEVKIYRVADEGLFGSVRRLNTRRINTKKPSTPKKRPLEKKQTREFNVGEVLEAKVVSYKEPFFQIEVDGTLYNVLQFRIDCPPYKDFPSYVGQTLDFEVVGISKNLKTGAPYIEMSRKNIVLANRQGLINSYNIGDEITLGDFELNRGGIEAIKDVRIFVPFAEIRHNVHVSEKNVNEFVNADTKVQVISKTDDTLICSVKALLEDPFILIKSDFEQGKCPNQVKGIIRNVVDFGAFVDLQGQYDITGLIPFRMVDEETKARLQQKQAGDSIDVVIVGVDVDKKHITLGVK